MMHSIDAEGRITAVSDRWLEVLGYPIDEVLGRRSVEFFTEESRARALEVCVPALRDEGKISEISYQFVKKNGEIIETRLSSVGVYNEAGEVAQYLSVFTDVTAELRAEQALRESEARWRMLMDLAPLPLCIHRDGVFVWVNDASVKLMAATSAEQMIGKSALELVHPDDRELVLGRLRALRGSNETLPPIEERYIRFDGSVLHVEVTARQIVYEGAPATQIAVVDVTARRQAEDARRLIEEAERRGDIQARIIQAQEEALRALSAPIIPIGEGVLVLPLVGRIGPERAVSVLETLADGVVRQKARVAIVDVTGVPEADADVAEALARVAQAVRLLGAEVVITGIQPAIARTLVELGVDLSAIATRATLREGIAHSLRRRAPRA